MPSLNVKPFFLSDFKKKATNNKNSNMNKMEITEVISLVS